MKKIALVLPLTALLFSAATTVTAQTTGYSYRATVKAETKLARKIKWNISPEFRVGQTTDTRVILLQTGLEYRLASWLDVGALYRAQGEWMKKTDDTDDSSFDLSNRFAVDASTKTDIGRFTPKFRARFCNFSDFDSDTEDKSNFMRYRLAMAYDIKGCKINPYISYELYQKLSKGVLSKARYTVGAEYALNSARSLCFEYSLDDKFKTSTRYHIFEVAYKFRF